MTGHSTTHALPSADVLLVDSEVVTAELAPLLRSTYRVAVASTVGTAREFLQRPHAVDVIVTDIELADGATMDLCREVKTRPNPPSFLVITETVERVPDMLEAGCQGVLLKPFAPNLIFARIGRLLRDRSDTLRRRPELVRAKAQQLRQRQRSDGLSQGTNRFWQTKLCPYCDGVGVTSFEFASHRRSWYACGACKKVWLGKREE